MRNTALKLNVCVIQFGLLALLIRREQDSFLVEGLEVDQIVEAETPGHAAQVLNPIFICSAEQFGEVTEHNDQQLGNQSSLLDEGQILLVRLIVGL